MFEGKNTIANLGCSILAHFGLKPPNATLAEADHLLAQGARNVVVLLLDGMGTHNMRSLLEPDGFFFQHLRHTYASVFPPTTVAATTSINSGLFPAQHGWLGWTMYYPQLQKNVTVFTNQDDEGVRVEGGNVGQRFMPYTGIVEQLLAAGHQAYRVEPFGEDPVEGIQAIGERLKSLCALPGSKYIYAYYGQPDTDMHSLGVTHPQVKQTLRHIERTVAAFHRHLEDTLLIITADHGHIDARGAVVLDYPELLDCLQRLPSIEPRTLNLFVKPGREQDFERAFQAAFGDDFRLYTRRQALEGHLFGPPPYAPGLADTLGDYIAVSMGDRALFNNYDQLANLKGVHAGGTPAEREIPLIAPPIVPPAG